MAQCSAATDACCPGTGSYTPTQSSGYSANQLSDTDTNRDRLSTHCPASSSDFDPHKSSSAPPAPHTNAADTASHSRSNTGCRIHQTSAASPAPPAPYSHSHTIATATPV